MVWIVPAALVAAALFLRLYRLHELAPGIASDEGALGRLALHVLQGTHSLTFGDREPLGIYSIAVAVKFLGRTPLALRLPAALASVLTVFVVFWLGRLMFGSDENGRETRRRGLVIASVASCLLTVSLGQTILGRTAYRGVLLPLFLALCLALLWWGWTRRRWWGIVLAGACAGILPYTYSSVRFVPFLFLLFGVSFLLPFRSVSLDRLRTERLWAAVFTGVAGLVSAPIFIHYIRNPDAFFNTRIQRLYVFGGIQGFPVDVVAERLAAHVWKVLSKFSFRLLAGCCSPVEHAVTLNAWEAVFFWLGVAVAVWQWKRRPAYRLLLLWAGLLTLPAVLSNAHSTMRMVGAVPAIYLLAAVGVWEAFQWSASRLPMGSICRRLAPGIAVGALLLLQGGLTYRAFFGAWMDDGSLYQPQRVWPGFAQTLNALPAQTDTVYLIANLHYGFEYLFQAKTPAKSFWFNPAELDHQIDSWLAAKEEVSTVRVVNWADWSASSLWGGNYQAGLLTILLGKYGRYVGTENLDGLHVDSYVDISHDRPWVLFEDLSRPVIYDGGIALEGVALGPFLVKLPRHQRLHAGQNRSSKVGMLWRAAPGLAVDYSISLRLYNSEGARAYQMDYVLRMPKEYRRTTSRWSAHQPVATVFDFAVSDDLAAGEYELRLVVYDLKTLTPTVEVGVWEEETVLRPVQLPWFDW
ncbi:MAG: hypothetical protein OXO48_02030 [Caldilineaceae bacterium]|nr:hypothetical protein [Caldilineaceae bacterium]